MAVHNFREDSLFYLPTTKVRQRNGRSPNSDRGRTAHLVLRSQQGFHCSQHAVTQPIAGVHSGGGHFLSHQGAEGNTSGSYF